MGGDWVELIGWCWYVQNDWRVGDNGYGGCGGGWFGVVKHMSGLN